MDNVARVGDSLRIGTYLTRKERKEGPSDTDGCHEITYEE
jgi:hypothetical protein